MQERWLFQHFHDTTPEAFLKILWRVVEVGLAARRNLDTVDRRMKAESDPVEQVVLVIRRNALAQTVNDVWALLRDLQERLPEVDTTPETKEAVQQTLKDLLQQLK